MYTWIALRNGFAISFNFENFSQTFHTLQIGNKIFEIRILRFRKFFWCDENRATLDLSTFSQSIKILLCSVSPTPGKRVPQTSQFASGSCTPPPIRKVRKFSVLFLSHPGFKVFFLNFCTFSFYIKKNFDLISPTRLMFFLVPIALAPTPTFSVYTSLFE